MNRHELHHLAFLSRTDPAAADGYVAQLASGATGRSNAPYVVARIGADPSLDAMADDNMDKIRADVAALLPQCGISTPLAVLESSYAQMVECTDIGQKVAIAYTSGHDVYTAVPDHELDAAGATPDVQALTCLRLLAKVTDGVAAQIAQDRLEQPAFEWIPHVINARLHDLLKEHPALAHPSILYPVKIRAGHVRYRPPMPPELPLPLLHWISALADATLPTACTGAPSALHADSSLRWANHPVTTLALATPAQGLPGYVRSVAQGLRPMDTDVLRMSTSRSIVAKRLTGLIRLDRLRAADAPLYASENRPYSINALVSAAFRADWASPKNRALELHHQELREVFSGAQCGKVYDFSAMLTSQSKSALYVLTSKNQPVIYGRDCATRVRALVDARVGWGISPSTERAALDVAQELVTTTPLNVAELVKVGDMLDAADAQRLLTTFAELGLSHDDFAALLEESQTKAGVRFNALADASAALLAAQAMTRVISAGAAAQTTQPVDAPAHRRAPL